MREERVILLIVVLFIFGGFVAFFVSSQNTEFNFYKSEITIDGNKITERLSYKPDKEYHTLYRDFESKLYFKGDDYYTGERIELTKVNCLAGTPYISPFTYGFCMILGNKTQYKAQCPAYTENNEYGCTFGVAKGFREGEDYWVEATYEIYSDTIFEINGEKYIKFEVYSKNKHKSLNEKNFIITGSHVSKNSYSSGENVIVYIPYIGNDSGQKYAFLEDYEYDNNFWMLLVYLLFCLLPAGILYCVWRFFGREKSYEDIPEELSMYPNERKAWEVTAYFQPPFNSLDKNFFAAMLINFYHKKIIDIKMKGKDAWIKINNYKEDLDQIETDFLNTIKSLFYDKPLSFFKQNNPKYNLAKSFAKLETAFIIPLSSGATKYIEGDYLFLKKAMQNWKNSSFVRLAFRVLHEDVKKIGKKYIDTKGRIIISVLLVIIAFGANMAGNFFIGKTFFLVILYVAMFFVLIFSSNSALFIRFNEEYYKEFQKWQAFKRFLKNSFSMKHHGYKGVAIWNNILVYSTALGVSKKVLDQLKQAKVIDENYYNLYYGVYVSSGSFSAASGSAGGAGGGAGGGGAGGGGGGGR